MFFISIVKIIEEKTNNIMMNKICIVIKKKEKKKWVVDTNTNRDRKWGRGKILKRRKQ